MRARKKIPTHDPQTGELNPHYEDLTGEENPMRFKSPGISIYSEPDHYTPSNQFNGLTPAELERLAILSEECGEVVQVIGKILRHGFESSSPFDEKRETNRQKLEKELGDLEWIIGYMSEHCDFKRASVEARTRYKETAEKYLHHNTTINKKQLKMETTTTNTNAPEKLHTSYPSRYAIGEKVALDFWYSGRIENCRVEAVRFTKSKVWYDVLVPIVNNGELTPEARDTKEVDPMMNYTLIENVDSVCVADPANTLHA